MINCVFSENLAGRYGGGSYNFHSSALFLNCVIEHNYAGFRGGGQYNEDGSDAVLANTIFYKNIAKEDGGGLVSKNRNSNVKVFNCIFYKNATIEGLGGGSYSIAEGTVAIRNSIFWANIQQNNINGVGSDFASEYKDSNFPIYTLVQEETIEGLGIINNQNPLFINPENPIGADNLWFTKDDGFQLQPNSPALFKGHFDNAIMINFFGEEREERKINMGAY